VQVNGVIVTSAVGKHRYHHRPHDSLIDPHVPGLRMSPAMMFEHGIARAGYIEAPRDPDLAFEFLKTEWRARFSTTESTSATAATTHERCCRGSPRGCVPDVSLNQSGRENGSR
jgi:hypothetical protein